MAGNTNFDPLSDDALELDTGKRYGVLMGLLDAFSMRYTAEKDSLHVGGVYQAMTAKHPRTMDVNPFDFAQQCFLKLTDRVDVSTDDARAFQDQIIALLASLTEMPKGAPDPIWLHYFYRVRNRLLPASIGDRIKAAREAAGLTQQQLADALELADRQRVSQWEAGYRTPHRITADRIAEILGTTAAKLMFGE